MTWKRARLSAGTDSLGFPRENILEKAGKGRSTPPPIPDDEMTDPEIIQAIVDRMDKAMREVFEAYHLMLINGQRCRDLNHKARAKVLRIPERTYRYRRDAGFQFIREWLGTYLDAVAVRMVVSANQQSCLQ